MSFFARIKKTFLRRKFRQAEAHNQSQNHHDFVDLEDARDVGIIVNTHMTSAPDVKKLEAYAKGLKSAGKRVFLIEINPQKDAKPVFVNLSDGLFINKEKLNWLGLPKAPTEKQFTAKSLDILLNFDLSSQATAPYLCTISKAKTRAGVYVEGQENWYELMLSISDNQAPIPTMLKQLDHYLKMLVK